MLWSKVLHDWRNGVVLQYPKYMHERFQWNTSVLKHKGQVPFKQSFKVEYRLPQCQDPRLYQGYIKKSNNKYAVAFLNLPKDAILVVPMPVDHKNYATLKDFIDNAPEIQQKKFWKKAEDILIYLHEAGNHFI